MIFVWKKKKTKVQIIKSLHKPSTQEIPSLTAHLLPSRKRRKSCKLPPSAIILKQNYIHVKKHNLREVRKKANTEWY